MGFNYFQLGLRMLSTILNVSQPPCQLNKFIPLQQGKIGFMQNCNHRALPPAKYACSIAYSIVVLYVLHCQHIPCADPFSGCNFSCCRLFRRRVRCLQVVVLYSVMPLELMDSLILPSLPLLSYLDGLKPYLFQ